MIKQFLLALLVFISAKEQTHINELKEALVRKAIDGDIYAESTIVTNARHYEALQKLGQALADVQRGLEEKVPGDLLAIDIRQCLHYLGTITGQITNEDQLDYIFSKFCIGKYKYMLPDLTVNPYCSINIIGLISGGFPCS